MISGLGSSLSSILSQLNVTTPEKMGGSADGGGFTDVFKAAIQQVDGLQTGADQQIGNLIQGKGTGDVGSVMASVEKADVAFQLMMQVRSKIVSAYQDIEKMQF